MNIGKQSSLNDLLELKAYLETQIAVAAAIKVGEVTQIESGVLASGSIFEERPTGVYYYQPTVTDQPDLDTYGMLLNMDEPDSETHSAMIAVTYLAECYLMTRTADGNFSTKVLTQKNTITDSNGFIKAA